MIIYIDDSYHRVFRPSIPSLLQSATVRESIITKCDNFISKFDGYYSQFKNIYNIQLVKLIYDIS